jgi:hypothetical protein
MFSVTHSVAQYSFSGNTSGTINVSAIQSIAVTGGTSIPSFSSLDDYFNGVVMSNYINVSVKSNVSWVVVVQSQNDFFSPQSSNASTNMPASVLSVKSSTSGTYLSLNTSGVNLKTGNKTGVSTTGISFSLDMKFNPGFNYKGGIYSIALLYTLSPQ